MRGGGLLVGWLCLPRTQSWERVGLSGAVKDFVLHLLEELPFVQAELQAQRSRLGLHNTCRKTGLGAVGRALL